MSGEAAATDSGITAGTTPDGGTTFLAGGCSDGIPVVFLHGIGGGARIWSRQLPAFGEGYRTVAWNMPGYAGSAAIASPTVEGFADALARFVSDLALDRPVLVGHSIGGMIVQSYLARSLGPVRAAVLAQTTPAFGGRDPAWAEAFVAARLGPLDRGATMAEIARESVAGMVGDDPDPDGVELARAAIASTPPSAFRDSTRAMIGFDLREAMDRIAVPTLLLAGSRDANAPAATVAKMAARIPGSTCECLDGCGHLAMLERPDAFNARLGAFLASLSDPGSLPS